MIQWWAALTLGLVSSFHCLGMCGPIAFALPLNRRSNISQILGAVSYNLGRIVTYGILGALFGLIGKSLVLAGAQRALSIAAGVFMLLTVFVPALFRFINMDEITYRYIGKLKGIFAGLFRKKSLLSLYTIGALNGLLPCAMVYLALAGAIAEGDASGGAAFMMVFGLGTMPMMFAASLLGMIVSVKLRNKLQKAIPVVVVIIGILFILRGLNLGIPYLSPEIHRVDPEITQCD